MSYIGNSWRGQNTGAIMEVYDFLVTGQKYDFLRVVRKFIRSKDWTSGLRLSFSRVGGQISGEMVHNALLFPAGKHYVLSGVFSSFVFCSSLSGSK